MELPVLELLLIQLLQFVLSHTNGLAVPAAGRKLSWPLQFATPPTHGMAIVAPALLLNRQHRFVRQAIHGTRHFQLVKSLSTLSELPFVTMDKHHPVRHV